MAAQTRSTTDRLRARARAWATAPSRRPAAEAVRALLSRLWLPHPGLLRAQARAVAGLGWRGGAALFEGRALRLDLGPPVAAGDLEVVLGLMARLEATGTAGTTAAGALIAEALVTEAGRARLAAALSRLRPAHPDSVFLLHLDSYLRAQAGDWRGAAADLSTAIARTSPGPRARALSDAWRVVDRIARDQMDWSGDPPAPGQAFKEQALQTRQRAAYMAFCAAELAAARTLSARLRAVLDMLRPSLRHSPSYSESHAQARAAFDGMRPEWQARLAEEPRPETAEALVLDLCTLLGLFRRFDMDEEAEQTLFRLETLSADPALAGWLWPAPATIVQRAADAPRAAAILDRIWPAHAPQTNRDVKTLFEWAMIAGRHDVAHAAFARLPARLRGHTGLLQHVQILIREGRLAKARTIAAEVHARALSHPARISPFSNASLVRRRGEIAFLEQTAALWSEVPQPTAPKGLVLLAARNIDGLRRYPLMVLREMKREGWAVVPLVSGLLPPETTGIAGIDALVGAISPNIRLSPEAEADWPVLAEDRRLAEGRFGVAGHDLSHPLWEEAAINRRRYTTDWSCPELQGYLGNLCDWTVAMARALEQAIALGRARDLPVAAMSLFNARLPDGYFRLRCAAGGDPDRLFFLHAANGYQNYFTNFSTNVSERFVLRNMTRVPHARSASFPVPENFERHCAARRHEAPALLERFAAVTRVQRGPGPRRSPPPEAEALAARVAAWRAEGGRVACAFGKVVCDSNVPFDGGPAHASMQDWINHSVACVQGSRTLLLIKPHPHERNEQIATFPTEAFADLIHADLDPNAVLLGHDWFDMAGIGALIDFGLVYNGTSAVELGLMGIPAILAGHFGPIDYPVGHPVPKDRAHYAAMLRGEAPVAGTPDLAERAALWLDYMARPDFTLPYRYHLRPVTNKVIYPPAWVAEDLARWRAEGGDPAVTTLMERALGRAAEPGAPEDSPPERDR